MDIFTPQSVYDALQYVTLGGSTCAFTFEKCEEIAPLLCTIADLKKSKNAVLLAHSYVSPEILLVADFVGDSFELSKHAQSTTAQTIVFSAVKFMAETAKILNPTKTVLIPNANNGCSLADSITEAQVRDLREAYPGHTFVCYINTSAGVKSLCDVCVTSSNVSRIIEAIPNENIYFLPDKLMAQNVANDLAKKGIQKSLRWWDGTCYVHEELDPDLIDYMRLQHPHLEVVSHPECSPAILAKSDYVGSTSQMIAHVNNTHSPAYFLLTECGLSSRLQLESPHKKFVGSCSICKYMKSNTLQDIVRVLQSPQDKDIITLETAVIEGALACLEKMFEYAT